MLLMLEQWDSPELELACLLDEAPFHNYDSTNVGEPWRADSALTTAARSADLEGSAWLYVVYKSDDPLTWGSKRIKLLSGGVILRANTTRQGIATGLYRRMNFEVVARHIFHNVVGTDTAMEYVVVTNADMDYEPKTTDQNPLLTQPRDPLFGWPESLPDEDEFAPQSRPFSPPSAVGVLVTWENHTGYEERWILMDRLKLHQYRFLLTEYQRRPFVKQILMSLGFVNGPMAQADSTAPSLAQAAAGHLHNISTAMDALMQVLSSGAYEDNHTNGAMVDDHDDKAIDDGMLDVPEGRPKAKEETVEDQMGSD